MITAFSSADQLRRRPAPVNTSMRRTGSGICLWSEIDMCRNPYRLRASTLTHQIKRWRPDIVFDPPRRPAHLVQLPQAAKPEEPPDGLGLVRGCDGVLALAETSDHASMDAAGGAR